MRSALILFALCAILPNPIWSKPIRDLAVEEMVSEQRIALVIGNSSYSDAPLKNPGNDARAMSAALKAVGFEVIEQIDADRLAMRRAIRQFGNRISRGGVGLFYYAGHGLQIDGQNYLVPIDADVQHEDEVEDVCILASSVLRKMNSAGNRVNIVVLDACRNNPFARSFRSMNRGLARMDAPAGTFVAYATSPGKVAADGDGDNGLYTANLLQHIKDPGMKIEDVFKKVRRKVLAESSGSQLTWQSSSLTGDFYFVMPQEAQPPPPTPGQAYLQILVNPVPSTVYVDNKVHSTNPGQPLNLTGLDPVEVKVRAEAPGYQSAEKVLTLQAGQWTTTTFSLLQATALIPPPPLVQASLVVRVGAASASVSVDGQYLGESTPQLPLKLDNLTPGDRQISVAAPGYLASSQRVQLLAGQLSQVSFTLKKKAPVAPVAASNAMVAVGNLGFSIDRHEVTNAEFANYLNALQQSGLAARIDRIDEQQNFYKALQPYGDHPVTQVNWHEAAAYCKWAGKRLPTADEWEQACQGSAGNKYPWGDTAPNNKLANFKHQDNRYPDTAPVGSFAAGASAYGILDMAGNVMEWTATSRGQQQEARELRGGSWRRQRNYVRCSSNYSFAAEGRYDHFGFRCAR